MTFCFLGTLFLKNYNYYISNFLHILATVGFILLFYLFDFHKGKELLNNYSNIELTVLIFAYILLTIIIGATSIIGLKEFMNIYKNFYKKRFNISQILCSHYCLIFIVTKIYSCCKKKNKMMEHSQIIILDTNPEEKDKKKDKNNKINEIEDKSSEDIVLNNFYKETKNLEESDKNLEQFIFIFFSSLTCLGIIGINAAIFKSFKNISTKSIFSPILIVYVSSFILSLILYFFYSIPKIVISVKKNVHNQVEINDSSKTNDIKNENLKTDILYTKVNNKNNNYDNNLDEQFNNNNKLEETDEKTESDNPDDNQLNNKVQNYRNACTCFGYVYFSKNVNNKTVCICHKYYTCCFWFKSKIVKLEIFCPILIEVYLQLSSVGYNSVLSDKLLEEYTTSKIVKFFRDFFLTIIILTLYIALSKIYVLN